MSITIATQLARQAALARRQATEYAFAVRSLRKQQLIA